jgi:hypothetical protein
MKKYIQMSAMDRFIRSLSKKDIFEAFLEFITRPTGINEQFNVTVLESDRVEEHENGFTNCSNCNKVYINLKLIDGLCIKCFVEKLEREQK